MNRAGARNDKRNRPAALAFVEARRDKGPDLVHNPGRRKEYRRKDRQFHPHDAEAVHGADLFQRWRVDFQVSQRGCRRANNDGPELVAEKQTQEKRHADAADGEQEAFAEFLEVLEETHPRHALFFVVLLVGRFGRFGRFAAAARADCGRRRRGNHRQLPVQFRLREQSRTTTSRRNKTRSRRSERAFVRSFTRGSANSLRFVGRCHF